MTRTFRCQRANCSLAVFVNGCETGCPSRYPHRIVEGGTIKDNPSRWRTALQMHTITHNAFRSFSFSVVTSLLAYFTFSSPSWAEPPAFLPTAPPLEKSFFEDILTPRKKLPYALLGVNAFANDQRFGSIRSQFREVRSTLNLKDIRVLFAWNDAIQPTPTSTPFFGFYDEIARSFPPDVRVLVIITGTPSWMNDPKNWVGGDPRRTFVERWMRPVVSRYRRNSAITAFQIWNEPNNPSFAENNTLQVTSSPGNYVQLMQMAYAAAKRIAPRKRIVMGATTAIAQNFPDTLAYNKELVSLGIQRHTDIYAIHYYGINAERVILPNGVRPFLRSLGRPIWVTETGKQGTLEQLEYAERVIPFLVSSAPSIQKIFLYQFTEATPADDTYGLRNLTPGRFLSDLYINLRDRVRKQTR